MKLKLNGVLVLFIVVLGSIIFMQHRAIQRLGSENERLRNEAAGAAGDEKENSTHAATEGPDQQRARSSSELLRLRAEVNALRRAAKNATNNLSAHSKAEASDAQPMSAPPEAPVNVFETTAEVLLQPGETFMTGGWETRPGKRTLVLASPTVIDPAGNADPSGNQVTVRTHFIEMPDAVLQSLNAPQAGDGIIQATFSESGTRALLEQLRNTTGVDILAAPATTTVNGRRAQVALQEVRTFDGAASPTASPGADQHWIGPSVDLVPVIAHNGAVSLSVAPRIALPNPNWGH